MNTDTAPSAHENTKPYHPLDEDFTHMKSFEDHTEAPDNTGVPFNLPLKVSTWTVDKAPCIRDAFGMNVATRFPIGIKGEHIQYIVTAVNSYSTLKAENETLKEGSIALANQVELDGVTISKLKAENEEKKKRIKELEVLLIRADVMLLSQVDTYKYHTLHAEVKTVITTNQ